MRAGSMPAASSTEAVTGTQALLVNLRRAVTVSGRAGARPAAMRAPPDATTDATSAAAKEIRLDNLMTSPGCGLARFGPADGSL